MSHMQCLPTHVFVAFQSIEPAPRRVLLEVRELIFEVAANDPRVGQVEETLRWGEPAYITTKGKTGSTIRLGIEKVSGMPAVFFNCKTTLVEEFRSKFGDTLRYSKNRAVILDRDIAEMEPQLTNCIGAALTYHLGK